MNRQGDVSHAFALVASVIVPVYNGSATIVHCLQALANQTVAPDCYEIIVVDDGSTDTTHTTVTAWCQHHPHIRCKLIRQSNQGPAAARNRGAEVAQGVLLLFTDADCRPVAGWIAAFVAAFDLDKESSRATNAAAVTDRPVSAAMGTYRSEQQTIAARFAQLEFAERYVHMHHEPTLDVVATYSAAFRRTVFADAKGFDPAFPKANNEDVELSYRLSELGHRMIFVPAAVVYHPHGATWWDYAQTKLGRAYWRTIVYKRYPAKAIKDSYTPQILKVQILLAPLCLVGLLWFFLTQEVRALLLLVPFLLTTLPMIRFAWQQREVRVAFWTPWGLWIRSLVFALGVATGLLFGNRTEQAVESVLQK